MKKTIIAVILSFVMTVGTVGAVPVTAAETEEGKTVEFVIEISSDEDEKVDSFSEEKNEEKREEGENNENLNEGEQNDEEINNVGAIEESKGDGDFNNNVEEGYAAVFSDFEDTTEEEIIEKKTEGISIEPSLQDVNTKSSSNDTVNIVASGICGENATWTLTGEETNLTLTISGKGFTYDYTETSIPWASNRSKIKTVIVEQGIVKIGNYSFYSLNKLSDVFLPNTLLEIGKYCFGNCVSLESINIPSSVALINVYGFYNCSNLSNIVLPERLYSLEASMFENCESLTSIMIPEGIIEIPASAFKGCSNLSSISLPESISRIGNYAFYGCEKIEDINIPDSVVEIGWWAFYQCKQIKEISIPNNISSIGAYAFYGCENIEEIIIPESIVKIEEYSFFGCSKAKVVSIPGSITTIGKYAFCGCSSLNEIDIPDNVILIGEGAFRECSGIETFIIPNGITIIPEGMLLGCSNLKNLTIPDSVLKIGNGAFRECSSITNIIIPDSVTEIGDQAFCVCESINHIIIPYTVKSIGNYAFANCTNLSDIIIPQSVKSIGEYAFSSCQSLVEFDLPKGINKISAHMFNNCQNLKHVTIHENIKIIGEFAFRSCSSLTELYIPETVEEIAELSWNPFYKIPYICLVVVHNSYAEEYAINNNLIHAVICKVHTWEEEYTVDLEPTCTQEGTESIHCFVCGIVNEETVRSIPKTEHKYGEWTVTKDATPTEEGSREKVCADCGDKVTETIPATGIPQGIISITASPEDVSVKAGETASFHVEAEDSEGTKLTYQWQWSSDGTTWKNCSSNGYNTDTFSFTMKASVAGRKYRCEVSNGTDSVWSNFATLSLAKSAEIILQPADTEAAVGEEVCITVAVDTVSSEGVTYQWQFSTNGTTWKNCTSVTYNTDTFRFTMRASLAGRKYRCVISAGAETLTSKAATISLKSVVEITGQPVDVAAATGDTVNLHVGVQGSDSILTYQWQYSKNGMTWKNCTSSGCNSDTFSFKMIAGLDGRQYRCLITTSSETLISDPAVISLGTALEIIDQPTDISAHVGEKVNLHVGVEGSNLTYQWQYSNNGTTWKNCTSTGCNTDTFSFKMTSGLNGRQYRCCISNGTVTRYSDPAYITIKTQFEITINSQPEDVAAQVGERVSFHVGAEGENLTYQWQWTKNGTTWNNCTSGGFNTDTFSFTMKATIAGRRYRCIVSSGEDSVFSESAVLELYEEDLPVTSEWLNNYQYYVIDDAVVLTQYIGENDTVIINGTATVEGLQYEKVQLSEAFWHENEYDDIIQSLTLEEGVILPDDCSYFFSELYNLSYIDLSHISTSNVISMKGLFFNCDVLSEIVFGDFDTSNVVDMSYAFYNCGYLTSLDLSRFDLSKAVRADSMINGCKNLSLIQAPKNLGVEVTLPKVFENSDGLVFSFLPTNSNESILLSRKDIEYSDWLKNFEFAVKNNYILLTRYDGNEENIIIPGNAVVDGVQYNAIQLTHDMWYENQDDDIIQSLTLEEGVILPDDCSYYFSELYNLLYIDLSHISTSNVISMQGIFQDCDALTEIVFGDFDASNVVDISNAFCNCSCLSYLDLSSFDLSKTIICSNMLNGCESLLTINTPKNLMGDVLLPGLFTDGMGIDYTALPKLKNESCVLELVSH